MQQSQYDTDYIIKTATNYVYVSECPYNIGGAGGKIGFAMQKKVNSPLPQTPPPPLLTTQFLLSASIKWLLPYKNVIQNICYRVRRSLYLVIALERMPMLDSFLGMEEWPPAALTVRRIVTYPFSDVPTLKQQMTSYLFAPPVIRLHPGVLHKLPSIKQRACVRTRNDIIYLSIFRN